MRIANSNVEFTSTRFYSSHTEISMHKGTMLVGSSDGMRSFTDTLTGLDGSDEKVEEYDTDQLGKSGEETLFTNYNSAGGFAVQAGSGTSGRLSEIENIRMQLMERILNLMQALYGQNGSRGGSRVQNFMQSLSERVNSGGYRWMNVSTATYIHTEEEKTAFSAQGIARTEDGRELSFNVNLSMSRKFTEKMGATHMQPVELIDPLVINVGNGVTEISDQTFEFDIDSDGETDTIHKLGQGAGFLAYDRNGDGIINNGTELFGARSGDGFSELAEFDSDLDGWIDEDDEIFDKLRIWCVGEDGKDTLMTLKEADVGAIYLDKAETKFSSQGSDFMVNAQFRSSGIFLRESTGDVGIVHQIDMAKTDMPKVDLEKKDMPKIGMPKTDMEKADMLKADVEITNI